MQLSGDLKRSTPFDTITRPTAPLLAPQHHVEKRGLTPAGTADKLMRK
jgi:hypothetical protein